MTEPEARAMLRRIEQMLGDAEIGLLLAEESEVIPDYWGVVIHLTSTSDLPRLQQALARGTSRFPPPPEDPGYDPTAHYASITTAEAAGIDY